MTETIKTFSLKEELLYEVNHSEPETLELIYYFGQTLKKASPKDGNFRKTHDLARFAGIIDYQEGQEMIDCIK